MQPLKFSAVCFVMLFTAMATAQSQHTIVADLHQQKFEWMVAKDTTALAALLHPKSVYIHSNGWHETKAEVLMNIATNKLVYNKVTILSSTVRVVGTTAIVNGVGVFEVALNGQQLTIKLDYTEVYCFEAGWKLLSRHACRVE
jgi:hypothetical protein